MKRRVLGIAFILISIFTIVFLSSHTREVYAIGISPSCACVPSSNCYCSVGTSFEGTCPDTKNYIHCTQQTCNSCFRSAPPACTSPGVQCGPCSKAVDGTSFNGSYHTCCTSTCSSKCTPGLCSTEYTKTKSDTGIICQSNYTSSVSCDRSGSNCPPSDGCGSDSDTCYLLETNTTFIQSNGSTSGPATVSMVVDGITYSLSTNPAAPTHVKLPVVGSSNVQVTTPAFTAPTTSRGANYYYQVNNYGNSNEWTTWTTCSGVAGEDFCTVMPNANNTQNFVPTSKTVNQVLKEGATGKISAMYATTDKCANTYKYSTATEGYYVVDYVPRPPVPCTPGDPACTILADVGEATARGCMTTTYSGLEANNALHIQAEVTDSDSNDEIQAFTLWFSKDASIPTVGTIAASYTGSVNTDVGIMIKKNGANWTNPNIYSTNSNFSWGQLPITSGKAYIKVNGTNIIEISDISVTQGTKAIFDYKINFLNTPENLSGIYNIYTGSLDTFMINGNTLDQSYFYKIFNWGVDLVNPTVNDITQQIQDPKNTFITWGASDATSGIMRTIINGYRLGGVSTDPSGIKLYLPSAYTILKGTILINPSIPIPPDSEIGLYNDINAWKFDNNTGEKDLVNIGDNESGQIPLYITTYDRACNTNGNNENIDLNPWFATRGGTVYSQGNISTTAKDVSSVNTLDGVFNAKTLMNKSYIDLGTELLSTRNTRITNLMHSGSGAVQAIGIEDTNNSQDYWYYKLLRNLDKYKPVLTSFTKGNTDRTVSASCLGSRCYMYSTQDLTIPSGYVCDKPTLFITEKDIHLNPDITSIDTSLSGCIFVAKNNIYVDAGTFKSGTGTKVQYDFIEGYLIADNQIIFSVADESQTLRDAVEIYGGAVALGTTTGGGNAISIQRNLRLYSQINPTVVITYDNKYNSISTIFFGTESNLYKQEIGFKSF